VETVEAYDWVWRIFGFVIGAVVGSFLNVCIYRLPRELSVNEPSRSFCPSCKAPIPWTHNLPLLSWLWLRGRCARCGAAISFRYFAVELITAILFVALWVVFPWPMAIAYWVLVSLLIAATFIDLEHFIIPDGITIGGTVAGVIASVAVPALMGKESRVQAFIYSLGAAVLGYGLLWLVMEGGKKLFGKVRVKFKEPAPFSWVRQGEDAEFIVSDDRSMWSDHFARESDLMLLRCTEARVDERSFTNALLQLHCSRLTINEETFVLDEIDRIEGIVSELQLPREAMGRGDLKFLAAIGAFLGWRGILCSIFAGSLIGSIVGLAGLAFSRRAWSAKIPFGPYLALGALIWLFAGQKLLDLYGRLLNP
jgi:leader peptidase (prepilin peptidase)/N-methyltransferase